MISGEVDFGGSATLNGPLATATQVSTFYDLLNQANKATVMDASGDFLNPTYGILTSSDYGPVLASSANFAHPYIFNPSTNTDPLWSVGGFSFNLLSSTIISQNTTFLNIIGSGLITGNGFDTTAGNWSFTITRPNGTTPASGKFSFTADTASLPDGGSAVALFGFAIIAVEGVRRLLNAPNHAE